MKKSSLSIIIADIYILGVSSSLPNKNYKWGYYKTMINIYKDENHKKRYEDTIFKFRYTVDRDIKSMFYLITGVQALYSRIDDIYDFVENRIKKGNIEALEDILSRSEIHLLYLGLDLFNQSKVQSNFSLFNSLDEVNFNLALNAIKIRFNQIYI